MTNNGVIMINRVQIWNPIAKHWVIIDTEIGVIIDRSKEPVEGIEKTTYLEMAH